MKQSLTFIEEHKGENLIQGFLAPTQSTSLWS